VTIATVGDDPLLSSGVDDEPNDGLQDMTESATRLCLVVSTDTEGATISSSQEACPVLTTLPQVGVLMVLCSPALTVPEMSPALMVLCPPALTVPEMSPVTVTVDCP